MADEKKKKGKKKKIKVEEPMDELVPVKEEEESKSVGSLVPKAVMVALKELLPRIDCSFIKPKDFYVDKSGDTHIEFVVGDEYEVFIIIGFENNDVDTMTTEKRYSIRINNLITDSYRKITYESYESIE